MSRCEAFWTKCDKSARKVAIFENVFKQPQKLWLCDTHAAEFAQVETRQALLDRALDTLAVMRTSGGMTMTTKELLVHPAHETLVAHQKDCARCAAVRDWIAIESLEGRVRDQADINRIGEYVIKHACPEGVALNEAVGRAMREG